MALGKNDNILYGWGNNNYGQITGNIQAIHNIISKPHLINLSNKEVEKVACGSFHTLFLAKTNLDLKNIFIID